MAGDWRRRFHHHHRRSLRDGSGGLHRSAHAAGGRARNQLGCHQRGGGAGRRCLHQSLKRWSDHRHQQQRAGRLGQAAHGGRACAQHADRRCGSAMAGRPRDLPGRTRPGARRARPGVELRPACRGRRPPAAAKECDIEAQGPLSTHRHLAVPHRHTRQGGRHRCDSARHALRRAGAESGARRQGPGRGLRRGAGAARCAQGADHRRRCRGRGRAILAGAASAQGAEHHLGSRPQRPARYGGDSRHARENRGSGTRIDGAQRRPRG